MYIYMYFFSVSFISEYFAICKNSRGDGGNKWKWVEKVVAVNSFFKNRDKGGGEKCLKMFTLVKCRNQ